MKLIENTPLSSRAADEIRNSIIYGDYAQGQKITEEECASALGLSRVCVREAFVKLQSEGLIEKQVNKSTTVTVFTSKDVRDIYYLRLSLEKMCSTLCFERNTLPEKELLQSCERMERLAEKSGRTASEMLHEDFIFHAAIVDSCGSARAAKVWHEMQSQMLTLLFPVLTEFSKEHNKTHNIREHRALLDALLTRDTAVSHPAMETHILQSMNTLLQLYE